MIRLAKWLSVRLTKSVVVGSNPVAVLYTSDITCVLSKEFLDSHATTECRFTLKCVCDMIRTHSLLVIVTIFFILFTCIHFMSIFLARGTSCGHRISCPSHHMERTDNKPFSGLVGPRHMATSRAVLHKTWVARCSPHVL